MPHMISLDAKLGWFNDADVEAAYDDGWIETPAEAFIQLAGNVSFLNELTLPHNVKKLWGNQPVIVSGTGPSSDADIEHTLRIQVNPRPNSLYANISFSLDKPYWQSDNWKHYQAANGYTLAYYRKGYGAPAYGIPYEIGNSTLEENGYSSNHNDDKVYCFKRTHRSATAAMLLARYLTDGPIILTGIDLQGKDAAGYEYEYTQYPVFCLMTQYLKDVYIHPDMTGPLNNLWPKWEI